MSELLSVVWLLLVGIGFGSGQECDSSGVRCVSCNTYEKCNPEMPDGQITGCENGTTCGDSILERCKAKFNCYAGGECTSPGIFPDPLVEANFYVCLGDPFSGFSRYTFSCQTGQYFDASTYMCIPSEVTDPTATTSVLTTGSTSSDITLSTSPETTTSVMTTTDLTTTTPITTTTTPLTTTTTPLTTTTTPLTTTTTPLITTTTPLTTTASTTSSSITTSGTSEPPTASPVTCITPGIFPVLTNCKLYYRCSTSLQLFYFTCPGNSYFNEMILKCSLTISPNCQAQILKNTTSPAPASTTTTTPVSTTAVTPATAATTPPITFVCPSIGTYENPASCKTYFRCLSSGKIFIFTCPGASYFNEITKTCTLVLTPRCLKLMQP